MGWQAGECELDAIGSCRARRDPESRYGLSLDVGSGSAGCQRDRSALHFAASRGDKTQTGNIEDGPARLLAC